MLGFLAGFPRKYLCWGGVEGLGIFDLLLSVHNPFYEVEGGHIFLPFIQRLSRVLPTSCRLAWDTLLFPRPHITKLRSFYIWLRQKTRGNSYCFQLLTCCKSQNNRFIFLTFCFLIHSLCERSLVVLLAEDARTFFDHWAHVLGAIVSP